MPKTSSACASFTPPRPTYGWSGLDRASTSASRPPGVPAFDAGCAVDADLPGEDERRAPARARPTSPRSHEQRASSRCFTVWIFRLLVLLR